MSTEDFRRKLAAIFSADVEGYSRLMGEDELATVQTLTSYKETMGKLIKHYRGRVVDSTGDNLLAEFASVVDAVQCAVEVQQIIKGKNEDLPENRRMLFRIGINLGDVIEEDDRIFGDGVNIAARVESLSEGGGVCISGNAFEQIENKLALGYQYMGEHAVKNIVKPIKVYKVPMGPVEVKKKVVAVPEKPSIAVLPFANISGDPKEDYLSDGITENIITALSKIPQMLVIARNSVFTYKAKPVMVQQVSEELGVQYVLEGSVQRSGDRLRVTAQLIDAKTGNHLWAERYDRDLKDLFALQDEITMKVITELQVKLTEGEYARMVAKGTTNFEAYLKCLQAIQTFRRITKEDNLKARKMFEEIIVLDPNYPRPYIYLGWTYSQRAFFGWTKSRKEDLARAEELARKALELDDSLGMPHRLLSDIWTVRRQWDKAFAEAEQAVSKTPNTLTMFAVASILFRLGRHQESITWFEKILRLDPFPPAYFLLESGGAYFLAERYEDALAQFKRVLELAKKGEYNLEIAHRILAAIYSMLGQEEEARNHAEEILRIDPKFSLESFAKWYGALFKNQADGDRFINALRKAGLK